MLHGPQTYQCACATETSLAMYRNCSMVRLRKVIFYNIKELVHYLLGWVRPIDKEEIVVRNSSVYKMRPIVFLVVESYHLRHADVVKNVDVFSRMLPIPMLSIPVFNWTHESHELTRDDPIQVTIFHALVVLVLFDIEGPEVIPSEADCVLEALQAVEEGAVVEALTFGGVSVMSENWVVRLELRVCVLRLHFEYNDHKCSHEEGAVDEFVSGILRGAVVENLIFLEILVAKEASELSGEPVDHCEVQRTKILVERKVCQIVIDIEEKGVLIVLWRLQIGHPVQFICKTMKSQS